MTTTPEWYERSACSGTDIDFFHHRPPHRAALDALCESCPVSAECLDAALFPLQTFGIWAGTDPDEREAMLANDPTLRRRAREYAKAGERQPARQRRVRKQTV